MNAAAHVAIFNLAIITNHIYVFLLDSTNTRKCATRPMGQHLILEAHHTRDYRTWPRGIIVDDTTNVLLLMLAQDASEGCGPTITGSDTSRIVTLGIT